jgi:hypothetical protein
VWRAWLDKQTKADKIEVQAFERQNKPELWEEIKFLKVEPTG